MKKMLVCAVLLTALIASCAWCEEDKYKDLGTDSNRMQWYLRDYGRDSDGVHYAVARKYYSNESIKNNTIELLMSKFAVSPEKAASLKFTEYKYEYNADGTQWALASLIHYDMVGNEIHSTVYTGEDKKFSAVSSVEANHAVSQGAMYAFGRVPAKKTTAPAAKSSSSSRSATTIVPAKRVVMPKKK